MSFREELFSILKKELWQESATKFILNAMLLFSVLLIFIVAFPFASIKSSPEAKVILVWVIIYFASTSGLSQAFGKEVDRGTIFHLKLYFKAEAIFWAKSIFNFIALLFVTSIVLIIFSSFFNFPEVFQFPMLSVLFLSLIAISINGSLLSALIAQSSSTGVLYAIIAFPILFPIFLLGISYMTELLHRDSLSYIQWTSLVLYDIISFALAYLLFDFIWEGLS